MPAINIPKVLEEFADVFVKHLSIVCLMTEEPQDWKKFIVPVFKKRVKEVLGN